MGTIMKFVIYMEVLDADLKRIEQINFSPSGQLSMKECLIVELFTTLNVKIRRTRQLSVVLKLVVAV